MNNLSKAEKLNIANEILASSHVSSVEAVFDYENGNARFYRATTYKNNQAKHYTVSVEDRFENGEKQTFADCDCQAGEKKVRCRHLLKIAQLDAARENREMFADTFVGYRAHKNYKAKREAMEVFS